MGGRTPLLATNTGRDTQAIVRHGEGVVIESRSDLTCTADPTGRWLLVTANEDGYSRLELRDGATLELHAEVPLPGRGVAEDFALPRPVFTPGGGALVYGFISPVEPGDVWVTRSTGARRGG